MFGIRPEDIKDSEIFINTFPQWEIDARVQVYELLGAEALLYFEYEGNKITASVHPRTHIREGQDVSLILDMEKAYFFDPDTGRAIIPQKGDVK